MKRIVWEVQCLSLLPVRRYCKKCGQKTTFHCSEQFRVNAQRQYLDIWLIYKCTGCNTTWNAAVYSRVSPKSLRPALLDGFHENDQTLVTKYAMDHRFLHGNGVEIGLPQYSVRGDGFSLGQAIELEIKSPYALPIKVSSLVRDKLRLSQKAYAEYIARGKMKSIPPQDLQKCRLKNGIILVFG